MKIGDQIPEITLTGYHQNQFKEFRFNEYVGSWLILLFYPSDFSFVCPTELEEAARKYPDFKKNGAEIFSISTDSKYSHKAWHDTSKAIKTVDYPMLADPTGEVCRAFGTYIEQEGVSLRATFIIDPEGRLVVSDMHNNSIGRNIHEIFRKFQAAQYVSKHEDEMCPADWEPGDEALTPKIGLVGRI